MLELGVPVWLVSVMAEVLGTARRHEVRAGWNRTPAGLVADHLHGQLSRRELHKRLLDLGQPLPASKAQRTVRRPYTTPPMAWLHEAHEMETASANGQPSEAETATELQVAAQPKLEIQTLGTLRVTFLGEDLTTKVLRRPTAAFVWQYELARAISAPEKPTSREWLADELYPGFDNETQRGRLRHRLYDLQQVLQGPLASSITMDAAYLRFDLSRCKVDVVELLDLARRCQEVEGLLSPATVAQMTSALAASSEEFLPDWEDLEHSVTAGRGTAGSAIREVRSRLEAAKAGLLESLGDHYLAARDPSRAAELFEEAAGLRPEHPDLRHKLVEALDASGRRRRAEEVRQSYLERTSEAE